ncbi:MAG: DUF6011 domain-containing protein [Nocardioidaceae bacterium]
MTETDILGRTEEQIQADREHARQARQRITTRDWRDVPKGHYALPVENWVEDEGDEDFHSVVVGWTTWERRTPKAYKNGRVTGKNMFIRGALIAADGTSLGQVRDFVNIDAEACRDVYGRDSYTKTAVDQIIRDIEGRDTYRAQFGKLTGHCGICGRALSDPRSKLLGIGPDCRGYK